MLESNLIISTIASVLFGSAGGGGIMYWVLKKQDQDHNHEIDISDRFENRLDKVENRLHDTQLKVRKLKKRENKLVYSINILIKRIEKLVGALDKYDELSQAEKDKFTSIPKFESLDEELDEL